MRAHKIFFAFSMAFICLTGLAQYQSAADVPWDKLEKLGKDFRTHEHWKSAVIQTSSSKALGTEKLSQGELYFFSPRSFFYQLKTGEVSEFVSNGKEAWLVKKSTKETAPDVVHFKNPNNVDLIGAILLLRNLNFDSEEKKTDFLRKYRVRLQDQGEDKSLELNFVKSATLSRIAFHFKKDQKIPDLIEVEDSIGHLTKVQIEKPVKLSTPNPLLLKPKIPEGAKVREAVP